MENTFSEVLKYKVTFGSRFSRRRFYCFVKKSVDNPQNKIDWKTLDTQRVGFFCQKYLCQKRLSLLKWLFNIFTRRKMKVEYEERFREKFLFFLSEVCECARKRSFTVWKCFFNNVFDKTCKENMKSGLINTDNFLRRLYVRSVIPLQKSLNMYFVRSLIRLV